MAREPERVATPVRGKRPPPPPPRRKEVTNPQQVDAAPPPVPRRQISSHGPEGDALLQEVRAATATLSALFAHRRELGPAAIDAIQVTLQDVDAKLQRRELSVAVVGEKHAGKSTFLDALLGERLLGTVTRAPHMITFLRRADVAGYRAVFSNGRVEEYDKRFPDRTAGIAAQVAEATAAEVEATTARASAARLEAGAAKEAEELDRELKTRFQAFENARAEADRLGEELRGAHDAAARLEASTAASEAQVPALVRAAPPPPWAVWLWVARFVALVLSWGASRAWRALVAERAGARAKLSALQLATSRAGEACLNAEAQLSPAAAPVEQARKEHAAARRALAAEDARLAEKKAVAESARRELEKHEGERRERFFKEVRGLCDAEGRGKDVVELTIEYPARLLPQDVRIIDAPGAIMAGSPAHDDAWRIIREQADGCILISELQRGVSQSTKRFLQQAREVVSHAVLVMTKMDQAFTEALRKGEGEPFEHVEQARRIGTRRFAKEIGRDPSTVLSVAVAAEPSLKKGDASPLARRFATDTAKLFQLLRHERALILGSRSAGLVRGCIARVGEVEERAERAYEERIAALEAQRIPEPERFCARELDAARPFVEEGARAAVASALEALREHAAALRAQAAARVDACKNKNAVAAAVAEIETLITEGVERVRQDVHAHLERQAEAVVDDIEMRLFEALRQQYTIAHELTRGGPSPVGVPAPEDVTASIVLDFGPGIQGALRSLNTARIGFGVGGAAAGALVGTAIFPGIGTAAGAAVGALLTFAKNLGGVKRQLRARVDASIGGAEAALSERIRGSEHAVTAAIAARLDRSVEQALERFGRWIAEPLEAERAAIQKERERLEDLRDLRQRLQGHDPRLVTLMQAAADASIGLCR